MRTAMSGRLLQLGCLNVRQKVKKNELSKGDHFAFQYLFLQENELKHVLKNAMKNTEFVNSALQFQ